MAENVTVREAFENDGPALAEIERQTPLQLGDGWLVIDRGDDYFAAARLMGAATVLIAEVDGPAGIFCAAPHPAVIGGIERRMLYIHHARILPFAQNKGLGKLLGDSVRDKYAGQSDSNYFYIAPGNRQSQAFARRAENKWSVQPALIDIETAAMRGPAAGRPATPADAPRIVYLLNAAHEAEEMYLPYTVESFSARMARAPKQYSWDRVWLSDRSVVGVWPEGESVSGRFIPLDGGEALESRGAAILDFGYESGGENELIALLGAWGGWLADREMTSLSLFVRLERATGDFSPRLATSVHSTSGRPASPSPAAWAVTASTWTTSTSSSGRLQNFCVGNCARVKACGTLRVRLKRGWAVGGVVDVHLRLRA